MGESSARAIYLPQKATYGKETPKILGGFRWFSGACWEALHVLGGPGSEGPVRHVPLKKQTSALKLLFKKGIHPITPFLSWYFEGPGTHASLSFPWVSFYQCLMTSPGCPRALRHPLCDLQATQNLCILLIVSQNIRTNKMFGFVLTPTALKFHCRAGNVP